MEKNLEEKIKPLTIGEQLNLKLYMIQNVYRDTCNAKKFVNNYLDNEYKEVKKLATELGIKDVERYVKDVKFMIDSSKEYTDLENLTKYVKKDLKLLRKKLFTKKQKKVYSLNQQILSSYKPSQSVAI
jgi:hypothetical protein